VTGSSDVPALSNDVFVGVAGSHDGLRPRADCDRADCDRASLTSRGRAHDTPESRARHARLCTSVCCAVSYVARFARMPRRNRLACALVLDRSESHEPIMMRLNLCTGAPDGAPPSGNAKSRTTRHRMTKTVSCDRNCSVRRVFGTMLLCLIPMAAALEDDLRGREATQEQRGERGCTASSRQNLRSLRSQQRRLTSVPVGPPFCVRGSRSSSLLRQSVLGASASCCES